MNQTDVREALDRLPAETRTYWTIHSIVVAVLLTGVACGVTVVLSMPVPVPFILGLAGFSLAVDLTLIPLRHRWYRYTVTPDECRIVRGRFVLRTVTLAVPQVLHTEISQGPLLRMFGLAEVRLKMVVGGQDIGPVSAPEAARIRRTVLHSGAQEVDDS